MPKKLLRTNATSSRTNKVFRSLRLTGRFTLAAAKTMISALTATDTHMSSVGIVPTMATAWAFSPVSAYIASAKDAMNSIAAAAMRYAKYLPQTFPLFTATSAPSVCTSAGAFACSVPSAGVPQSGQTSPSNDFPQFLQIISLTSFSSDYKLTVGYLSSKN